MDSSVVGLLGVVVVVLITEGVGIRLRRPLGLLLAAEKSRERSEFWSAYARILLLLAPALFALFGFPDATHRSPLMALVGQLRWGVAGLILTMLVLGRALRVHASRGNAVSFTPLIIPPVGSGPAR